MAEKRLTGAARKLRSTMTDAETALWSRLRGGQLDGFKFVRQFPVGPFVTDFACRSARLVVELDGGQHADSRHDIERTRQIAAHGYHVIRFWNNDVLTNIDGVLTMILADLHNARNR